MMNSPGTITSNNTDFDFSRNTHDTTPDEGEQMSEYINNGLEPKFVKERTLSSTEKDRVVSSTDVSGGMDSHGDVPGILLHFACQNPDLSDPRTH